MSTAVLVTNIFCIVFGVVVCFFGIYLRKVNACILGFSIGYFAGDLLLNLVVEIFNIENVSEITAILVPVVVGVVIAVLSAIFDRFFIVITGFLTGAICSLYILVKALPSETKAWIILLISAAFGVTIAAICYFVYYNAYAFLSAFDGGFLIISGALAIALPLIYREVAAFQDLDANKVSLTLTSLDDKTYLWATITLIAATVVFTICGCITQHKKVKALKG